MMKTAAAYIRVSTDEQIEYSPASQLEKIREYAKCNGYILPEEYIFVDEGISGRHTQKRIAFNRMIGIAKQKPKPFDAILLWKFSRFARNREDSIVYKSMLRKQCGIDVISISENLGDDKMSILIEALIEAMDEYYSINLAEEVKRGMNEKANRGEAVSIPSFGYAIKNGKYIPDKSTAPVLKRIFNDFLNGKGMRTIAMELNDEGYRTRRGNRFENRTVRYILSNPVYIGKIRWSSFGHTDYRLNSSENTIDGNHEPLIDTKTWNSVQEKLKAAPNIPYMHEKAANTPFMLQGLVRCDSCGATLCQAQKGKYLQCYAYAHGKCKVSHGIAISKINKIIFEALEKAALTGKFKLEIRQPKTEKNIADDISAQMEREKSKMERIKDAYESGAYTLDEFKKSKANIQNRIKLLQNKLTSASLTIQPFETRKQMQSKIINLLPLLRSAAISEQEKNAILKLMIYRIVFYRPKDNIDIIFYA